MVFMNLYFVGRSFIRENAVKLLNEVKGSCPRWLVIVLPAMVELADTMGLDVDFPEASREMMSFIFSCRESFLNKEELEGDLHCYPPLLSYFEALPPSFVSDEDICRHLSSDGSIFQSPSATAKAFMVFGNKECLTYLQSLAQRCPNGVPQAYPMDEDLIQLCMVNQLQKLGLGEYFVTEIKAFLAQVYRNYKEQNSWAKASNMSAARLHKNSLAFELLRTHGFKVSPSNFCWFLSNDEIRAQVEKDYEHFSSAMLHVFRASNLMFCGEYELEEARTFSKKLLKKIVSAGNGDRQQVKVPTKRIEHELNLPWFARLDHLEHRAWIQEKEANALWKGKASYNRLSYLYKEELLQLATRNFEFKQSLYTNEMKELKRWAEDCGISNMGFGREKTSYCYFAIAAATSSWLPHDSYIRMLVAKSAIIITVADDFFDMIGSISELEILTDAVGKWDSRGLSSHSKVIFDALDNLVSEATNKYVQQEGETDISGSLKDLKEKEDGKLNSILVNLIENPELDIEDSIAFVRKIIEKKKKEFLEHVLIDGLCDLPKPSKQLHLSCLKVFHMFFNSRNRFDSNTEMVEDINKAIYLPLGRTTKHLSLQPSTNKNYTTAKLQFCLSFKQHNTRMNFTTHQVSAPTLRSGYGMTFMAPKIGLGFI
ncbi:S-linalool synthase [Spatholobus suberectus]|nr:S-linalool synthase [Spatholobus suberectus]